MILPNFFGKLIIISWLLALNVPGNSERKVLAQEFESLAQALEK